MPATKKTKRVRGEKRFKIPELPRAAKRFVSEKIATSGLQQEFYRADIIFEGVDHGGASFEARVFLNNEAANVNTATSADQGYAGSFHIFGHGGCLGDPGHCEVRGNPRLYDPRPAHPLTPARKVVIGTAAVQQAIARSNQVTVTVVPIVHAGTVLTDFDDVLKFDKISIRTYA